MKNHGMTTLLLSLLLAGAGPARAVNLAGEVVDYVRLEGIPSVEITVSDTHNSEPIATTRTNATGGFLITGLPASERVTVRFERIGYVRRPTHLDLVLRENNSLRVELLLENEEVDQIAARFLDRVREHDGTLEAEWRQLQEFGLSPQQTDLILAQVELSGPAGERIAQELSTPPSPAETVAADMVADMETGPLQNQTMPGYGTYMLPDTSSRLPLVALISFASLGAALILWMLRKE